MEIDLNKIPNKKYFSTSEVSKIVGIKGHTLRYWEKEFENLFEVKKTSNKRIFKKKDIINLLKIKNLLKTEGMTIKGAKIKIKNFKIDNKTSIDILPILKKILKEL
ncbi:MAG: MerR family transcriptional regulator [Gammaproteobacteria bacterium]|nr:MAG: MerR family transcriptional regulator [Gammaproteobacteria bacterium]|tara:strand:- start:124 stop:441 length:318 start_codon:yes stop_codon:yes gene_type:complete